MDVVRAIRNMRQEAGLDPSTRAKVALAGETAAVRDLLSQIGELTRSEVTLGTREGAATVVRATEIRLGVDRKEPEERARLERQLEDALQMLHRSRDLLAQPGFAEKAPAPVVERERAKLAERAERVRLLEQELARLT
jgi:valyl-tRNA synthetase